MADESDTPRSEVEEIVEILRTLDASARATFLDDVCGSDRELRAQCEQLLANDSPSGGVEQSHDRSNLANEPQDPIRSISGGDVLAERFRIVKLLGKGGMGEVYEGRDLVLGGEPVALKTLFPHVAADESALERLSHELRLARRITHPNICRVHDVFRHRPVSDDAIVFFTMELLRGETLADRLRRGPMTTTDVLPVARQMAAAVDAAHQADVVHGDFKPANVMLVASDAEGERVVITDFGLARLRPVDSALSTTVASRQFGTPAYMAPEQLFGGGVTRATDVYAFGVVLYEMLTGHRPFADDSWPMLLGVRKLRRGPRAPREYVSGLNRRWEAVILRCLDVDPGKRFRSASEIIEALQARPKAVWRRVAPVAATLAAAGVLSIPPARDVISTPFMTYFGSEQTVALLPFTHESPTPEGDALVLGLTAAVTDRLGVVSQNQPRLYIAPAAQVIDTGVDTPVLVRQTLGANLIVAGRLSVLNDTTQLVIELNEVSRDDSATRGSRRIEIQPGDREPMEDKVVAAVAQLLGVSALPVRAPGLKLGAPPLRAEELYLTGRGYLLQGPGGVASAIKAFQQAIQEHDRHAGAYSGLSEAYLARYDTTRDVESLKSAAVTIDQALALDPGDARSHVIRGRVYLTTGQHQRAILEFQTALGLDPNSVAARNQLASAYEAQGATEMAEEEYRKSIAIHPRYWSGYEDLGNFLYRRGRYAEAEQNYVMGAGYAPANRRAIVNLAAVYEIQGRFLAAENELLRGLKLSPNALLYNNLGWIRIQEEKFDDAVEALKEAVKQPRADSVIWSSLARALRWAGRSPADTRVAYETALERADDELRVNPLNMDARANRAYLLAETGQGRSALEEIAAMLGSEHARGRVTILFRSALVHEWVGDRNGALEALELAVRGGYPISRIAHDPDLRKLRNDPGYRRVLEVADGGAN